jgi:ASC-1-like (ASCH) protein
LFDTFEELFNAFDHTRIGVKETDTAEIMNDFYSKEDQEKYKALGIEIKLI